MLKHGLREAQDLVTDRNYIAIQCYTYNIIACPLVFSSRIYHRTYRHCISYVHTSSFAFCVDDFEFAVESKLALILDLDHTLVTLDAHSGELRHRPGLQSFLRRAEQLCQLYLYTQATGDNMSIIKIHGYI